MSDNEQLVRCRVLAICRDWATMGGVVGAPQRVVNIIATAILDDGATSDVSGWLAVTHAAVLRQIAYNQDQDIEPRYWPTLERWCAEKRWMFVPEIPQKKAKQDSWLEGV